ncbi:tail fiber protein [Salmonella enterica]|nr:tail fiber protein [Salmonella enterica]EJJ4049375.1 tail fiber protein [Salmonella enterica]EJJ4102335.1 tail fiber protein [Salmonella enterica]EJJ4325017.1 tail fiber protein [Salmonella enterica]EJJ4329622.1 tail fiber protein [Salmonella enterica]
MCNRFSKNLGLGEGSALPVGVPVPWPIATPPTGWLKCNGAAFTAAQYPKLALAYPALRLPDLRGQFIRGWDDGRGVDAARTILSAQGFAQQRITGNFMGGAGAGSGSIKAGTLVNSYTNYGAGSQDLQYFSLDSAIETTTANEIRPVNIAFNYIVRAA